MRAENITGNNAQRPTDYHLLKKTNIVLDPAEKVGTLGLLGYGSGVVCGMMAKLLLGK